MRKLLSVLLNCLILGVLISSQAYAQKASNEAIIKMIEAFKKDNRGPYRDIRWFCIDGSVVLPQERCAELGGLQRARYKTEVEALAKTNHIFLGQILAKTKNEDLWDESFQQSRLKQYQLEQFLRANDNGWVNEKAQFYRGAYQTEDEDNWGIEFYTWLLEGDVRIDGHFFLIRQSAKDIPHATENNTSLSVRAISKEIADEYAPFMNLRIKIHGQPEASDIAKVEDFFAKNESKLNEELKGKFKKLTADMKLLFAPVNLSEFQVYIKKVANSSSIKASLNAFITNYANTNSVQERSVSIANLSLEIRNAVEAKLDAKSRLALIDISNKLETLLNQEAANWQPEKLRSQIQKVLTLTKAATGFGYLEKWEGEQLYKDLNWEGSQIRLKELGNYADVARRAVEWGTGMIRTTYFPIMNEYAGFEPLANGFIDEKVRASILLQLGSSASVLGDFFSMQAGFSNSVFKIENQSAMRGLNPGYAMGELVVTNESPETIEVVSNKIYIFNRAPADLKPVAGIATVSEGNLVSHVQLLARNLGIPNAVLSGENLNSLLPYNGKQVFYAVSNKGTVILKLATEMNATEKALFTKTARSEEKIRVPIEEMELSNPKILNLRDVDATFSGKISGPKAANLGQLKKLFPDNVVEGLVIPFSIFRQHFDLPMPQKGMSFWQFLSGTFKSTEQMTKEGKSENEVEKFVLGELETLQVAIKQMPLIPAFEAELKQMFKTVFGTEMGTIPVFIRSDTNMEDLKDFTGAGLNLTLFNVLDASKILQGIKDVWASPYTERSYKWRQKYLLNPENVFPSILIIPSVNADASGVMITKGVGTSSLTDVTVAFNRGVGGAVEGQASETWVIRPNNSYQLLSPSREHEFTYIPKTGGTEKRFTDYKDQILDQDKLASLRSMSKSLLQKLPEVGIKGPYDVELGFHNDKIYLFQVRPFVENKKATTSEFLRSITPTLSDTIVVSLDSKL
ncbi:PEP/pyruvate-binding domain-containing protein [Roseivirga echinicomitans]|uniref:Phosphoenolpyruvate synthase n=1 Tax=Roseivirga echinicomitans TaxID=296218 RepID=A0A150WYI8_9BACT|nr:PEP/pyruvate-binding domain-containing protein [Roseivirga echinicomitans]KYG71549.1 phosphoenolpyruvate synthase [Roseivirga echinicomitans]